MKKKPERFSNFPLWQKGLFLIVVGPLANQVAGFLMPTAGNSAAARGQEFGRGLVAVVCVIAGIVLVIMHFVRGKSDITDRNVAKRATPKTTASAVRPAGKNGGHQPGNYKAIGLGVLAVSLILTIAVLVGFYVAGNTTDVPRTGPGVTDDPNSMKPRKSYPVSIAVPEHSVFVPPNAKLTPGTRLEACWSGKWNPITTLSENEDGSLNVHWDEFASSFDCSMVRGELIIRKDVLKQFGDFPVSPSSVGSKSPATANDVSSVDPKPMPLKSYPVTISVPADSQFVPAGVKLPPGTRLQACWAGKWNPITLLSDNTDGNLTVRWDDFGEAYDCSMIRNELIIKTDVLTKSQGSP